MTFRSSPIACCAVALLLATGTAALRAETKPEKLYRKVLPSVVTLEVENRQGERFVGSAVIALGDDVVLTAWHVVWDARTVWATFADGERVKVLGCIDQDRARDLAALKLERKFPRLKATLHRDVQSVASRVYVIGAPKGYGFSISDGLISQVRSVDGFLQYQVSCPISSGNSGGPVLNERGEVIGIVSWTKSDAQNVSFAIPARELSRLDLSRRPVLWQELPRSSPPGFPPQPAEPRVPGGSVREEKAASPGAALGDFKRALEGAAGKTVTVIMREDGREETFTFTVPVGGWK